jgi:hypothetical protein
MISKLLPRSPVMAPMMLSSCLIGVWYLSTLRDPDTVAEVRLKAVNYPLFKTYSDHNETLCMGVDAARAFLLLNDVDVGKYLEHSTEYGTPNYYWRKKLEYDNVAKLLYHNLPEPCEYVSIRFEQKHRRGHYYEVWVTLGTNQIIGGGECR